MQQLFNAYVSVIQEMPPGRQAIQTVALPDTRRGEVVTRVKAACKEGQRAYWVCPLIEESEVLTFQDAESTQSNDGLDAGFCLVNPTENSLIFAGARLSLLQISG